MENIFQFQIISIWSGFSGEDLRITCLLLMDTYRSGNGMFVSSLGEENNYSYSQKGREQSESLKETTMNLFLQNKEYIISNAKKTLQ